MIPDPTRPTPDQILATMARCRSLAIPWEGVAIRSSAPRFATADELLTGEGSRRAGGRWNAIGSFPAVYTALDLETAMAETLAYGRYYGFAVEDVLPRTIVAVRLRLQRVLDLADDERALRLLDVGRDTIRAVDWRKVQDAGGEAITQLIGHAARGKGFEGILAPSAAREGGICLVYFPDRLDPDSVREILNADRLQG